MRCAERGLHDPNGSSTLLDLSGVWRRVDILEICMVVSWSIYWYCVHFHVPSGLGRGWEAILLMVQKRDRDRLLLWLSFLVGCLLWRRVDGLEARVSGLLERRLRAARTAEEMFRVFAKFNPLFVRPR